MLPTISSWIRRFSSMAYRPWRRNAVAAEVDHRAASAVSGSGSAIESIWSSAPTWLCHARACSVTTPSAAEGRWGDSSASLVE